MNGTLGYDDIRAATARQVAQLMAAAAITAPNPVASCSSPEAGLHANRHRRRPRHPQRTGGPDAGPREGTPGADLVPRRRRGRRDLVRRAAARLVPAELRLRRVRVRNLRRVPALHQAAETPVCAELEFTGPVCNLRDIDLGIAVGSAAKAAAIHSVDCRCQIRVAVAARKLGVIQADHSVALSPSMTSKAIGFDRAMPEADFDNPACRPPGRSRPAYRGWSATAAGETGRHPASRSAPPGPERRPAHPANPPGQSRSSRGGNGCAAEVLPSCSWSWP